MKRNPNGYGCVTKLTGERAKPYAVYSNSYKLNGKRHHDVIGYFKTEAEARNALAEWNKSRSTKNNYLLSTASAEIATTAVAAVRVLHYIGRNGSRIENCGLCVKGRLNKAVLCRLRLCEFEVCVLCE